MSVDPLASARGAGPPPAVWLAAVNRQSLAIRLLATTVHDVNNLLQVISGAAEVLALDPTPAAIAKRTTSIVGQSASATAVLQGLVTFVRAEATAADGARPLGLAQQTLTWRGHALKKLRLLASAEGDDVECPMAPHRLQQVLLNLVLNAEQALAGRASGVIQIRVFGGDAVRIVVDDNGPGIPEAAREAVFAWPPVPGAAPGALGIGLRVTRDLVGEASGTLTLETAAAGGLSAVVTLPLLRR